MREYETQAEVAALEANTRQFQLRGQTFTAKPTMHVRDFGVLYTIASGADLEGNFFELLNGVIRNTLIPESREAWDELLARELAVPIPFNTLMTVANDLSQEATGRPPGQAAPSGHTGSNGSTRSTDVSSSPPAVASAN